MISGVINGQATLLRQLKAVDGLVTIDDAR